jgi:hypothetical protein
VASRICPQCMGKVPAAGVAALSDGVECPNCHARLEVGPGSRMLAAWAGLAAGFLAWRLTRGANGMLGGVLTVAYAVLAFGFVSAFVVMLSGDLRPAPAAPVPEAAPAASHGHSGSHH